MRSRYSVRDKEQAHFVTSTVVGWLPVFDTSACCDILARSLAFCQREKGVRLYAWVIMDNHFHAVIHAQNLPRVMADLKKFTAGKLLAQLAAERRTWLLDLLAARKAAHKTRSAWQLWQERAITRRQSTPTGRCSRRSMTSMPILCAAAGLLRRNIGITVPPTNGSRPARRCFAVTRGAERETEFPEIAPRSQSASLTLGTRGKKLAERPALVLPRWADPDRRHRLGRLGESRRQQSGGDDDNGRESIKHGRHERDNARGVAWRWSREYGPWSCQDKGLSKWSLGTRRKPSPTRSQEMSSSLDFPIEIRRAREVLSCFKR